MTRLGNTPRRITAETHGFTLLEILISMTLLALVFLLLATFSLTTARNQAAHIRQEQAEALIEAEIERCRALAAQGYFTEIVDSNNRLSTADERSVRLKQVTITVKAAEQPTFTPVTRSTLIMVR